MFVCVCIYYTHIQNYKFIVYFVILLSSWVSAIKIKNKNFS